MIRKLFSAFGILVRLLLVLAVVAGLIVVAFVAYQGSQPMQQDGADSMIYSQFMGCRFGILVKKERVVGFYRAQQDFDRGIGRVRAALAAG